MMEKNYQSLEGRLDGFGQNHQQVTLQLKSLDERYESYNSRIDRRLSQVIEVVNKNKNDFDEFRNFLTSCVAQTRNRSLDDVNPITHNFNGNMIVPPAVGHSSQPRKDNFSPPVNNQPSLTVCIVVTFQPLHMWRVPMMLECENCHHVAEIPAPRLAY
ncbi:hypothetical protein LINGRAHAP2_LOCUS9361 [Linum grandiflorum]